MKLLRRRGRADALREEIIAKLHALVRIHGAKRHLRTTTARAFGPFAEHWGCTSVDSRQQHASIVLQM